MRSTASSLSIIQLNGEFLLFKEVMEAIVPSATAKWFLTPKISKINLYASEEYKQGIRTAFFNRQKGVEMEDRPNTMRFLFETLSEEIEPLFFLFDSWIYNSFRINFRWNCITVAQAVLYRRSLENYAFEYGKLNNNYWISWRFVPIVMVFCWRFKNGRRSIGRLLRIESVQSISCWKKWGQ